MIMGAVKSRPRITNDVSSNSSLEAREHRPKTVRQRAVVGEGKIHITIWSHFPWIKTKGTLSSVTRLPCSLWYVCEYRCV